MGALCDGWRSLEIIAQSAFLALSLRFDCWQSFESISQLTVKLRLHLLVGWSTECQVVHKIHNVHARAVIYIVVEYLVDFSLGAKDEGKNFARGRAGRTGWNCLLVPQALVTYVLSNVI